MVVELSNGVFPHGDFRSTSIAKHFTVGPLSKVADGLLNINQELVGGINIMTYEPWISWQLDWIAGLINEPFQTDPKDFENLSGMTPLWVSSFREKRISLNNGEVRKVNGIGFGLHIVEDKRVLNLLPQPMTIGILRTERESIPRNDGNILVERHYQQFRDGQPKRLVEAIVLQHHHSTIYRANHIVPGFRKYQLWMLPQRLVVEDPQEFLEVPYPYWSDDIVKDVILHP